MIVKNPHSITTIIQITAVRSSGIPILQLNAVLESIGLKVKETNSPQTWLP